MEKKEIAHRIHQEAGIPQEKAALLLNWIIELFKSTLQKGEPVSITNFGKFTVRSKTSRPGRNPRTGEGIMIAARRVVIFSASPSLKTEVNSVRAEEAEGLLP